MFCKNSFHTSIWLSFALLAFIVSVNSNANASCKVDYWVSTSGSDDGNGKIDQPFLTVDHARQVVRQNKRKGICTIRVNIESGTYPLTSPLIFDSSDAGSPGAKVVYRAAADNSSPVIISGGVPVTDFSCTSGNLCTSTVTGLPTGLMPRQFYVNGQRAIRARSNYGQVVNLNYVRVPNGYSQIIPETFTHPELVEAVTVTQWKMLRCPVASLTSNTL